MRSLLVSLAVVLASSCQLPASVRYRCEADGGCAISGTRCGSDGYCHPAAVDGGAANDGGTDGGVPCQPTLDLQARCAEVECGLVSNGCGEELDCDKWCPAPQLCGTQAPNRCGLPSLCTPDGWCWENPLPQGFALRASFRLDARHAWFVGQHRTVLRFDGEQVHLEALPRLPPGDFSDVHAAAADDVYVVGAGVIAHFDGATWVAEGAVGGLADYLRAVVGLGGGQALAADNYGNIWLRAPGPTPRTRWSRVRPGQGTSVMDLGRDGAGRAWALLRDGTLLSAGPSDFTTWLEAGRVPLDEATALVGVGDTLYVTGGQSDGGASLFRREADGGSTPLLSPASLLNEVFTGPDGVWALNDRRLVHVDGQGAVTSTGFDAPWRTGIALGGGRVVLATDQGAMALHREGEQPWLLSSPRHYASMSLGAVCGATPASMVAGGGSHSSLCSNDACGLRVARRAVGPLGVQWTWSAPPLPGVSVGVLARACYALSPDAVWLTTSESAYLFFDRGMPTPGSFAPYWGDYTGVWGLPDAGFFFSTGDSPLLTTSPTGVGDFTQVVVGAPGGLHGVWGVSGEYALAVGDEGTVSVFFDGQWTPYTGLFGGAHFTAVHGARFPNQGGYRFVVAGDGLLYANLRDGGFTVDWLEAGDTVAQVWVSTTGHAWAVGEASDGGALVLRADMEQPFTHVSHGFPVPFTGLWGFDEADGGTAVWVTGELGMVLRSR